jgi:hypothetical protein
MATIVMMIHSSERKSIASDTLSLVVEQATSSDDGSGAFSDLPQARQGRGISALVAMVVLPFPAVG